MPTRRAFLVAAAALAACNKARSVPPSAQHGKLGEPLPAIRKRGLGGREIDSATAAGDIVVVKFFAQYCKPCKKTLPAAEKLHRKYDDVHVIGVAEDEYRSAVESMVATHGLTFPVIHDAAHTLAGRFRVTEMPITFVTDREGIIRWVLGPDQPHDALAAVVASLR